MAKDKTSKGEAAPDKPEDTPDGAAKPRKLSGKTLILFIVLPCVLLVGGGAAAAILLMGGAPASASAAAEPAAPKAEVKEESAPAAASGEKAEGAPAGDAAEDASVGRALYCAKGSPCFYEMPKLIVNLAGREGERSPYMELQLMLEASDAAAFSKLPEQMPRFKNVLNNFLRELRVDDLNGSAGTWRLRRELLDRINLLLDPNKIDAVLVESMLVQ